jgi:signal transduction histidine kinase
MAEMIGCKVEFIGEQPTERRALLLLYAAIREALTNAVRHAGADRLIVEIRHDERCCRVTIASNGRTGVTSIQEGGGLSDLRRRLEQEGASLLMEVNDGVVMHVTIPVGENG